MNAVSTTRRDTDPVTPTFAEVSPFSGVDDPQGVYVHKRLVRADGSPVVDVAWPNRDNPSQNPNESEYAAVLASDNEWDYLRPLSDKEIEKKAYDRNLNDPAPVEPAKAKVGASVGTTSDNNVNEGDNNGDRN